MVMMNPLRAKEANNRPPSVQGCLGTQPHVWRNHIDVALDHLKRTHFDRLSAIFAIFQPLWSLNEALEEPKFLVKVPFEFQDEHGELYRSEKEAPNIEIWPYRKVSFFWVCQLHDFWSAGRTPHSDLRLTFSVWEEPPSHA